MHQFLSQHEISVTILTFSWSHQHKQQSKVSSFLQCLTLTHEIIIHCSTFKAKYKELHDSHQISIFQIGEICLYKDFNFNNIISSNLFIMGHKAYTILWEFGENALRLKLPFEIGTTMLWLWVSFRFMTHLSRFSTFFWYRCSLCYMHSHFRFNSSTNPVNVLKMNW